jgi:hypothetical protein
MFAELVTTPLKAVAAAAQKAQVVATHVALKAARVAEAAASKVASIQLKVAARAAARAQAEVLRAASKAQARALKALPKRPTVQFVREVRHGQTSLSFFRVTNHRTGQVGHVWSLDRVTPRGRVRLASGNASELRSLKAIVGRLDGRQAGPRHAPAPGPRAGPREQARATGQRPDRPGQASSPGQAPPREQPEGSDPERRSRPARGEDPPPDGWHTVLYVEGRNPDGTARTRVVRSFGDEIKAQAYARRSPALAVHLHKGLLPLRQGTVVNVPPRQNKHVDRAADRPRQGGPGQGQGEGTRVAQAAALVGTVANAAALGEQPRQLPSINR